jgi:branched-chain amino acid transport system permease protein
MIAYQLAANACIAGSAYALVALSFTLPYLTGRFFNFGHAAVYAWGAYLCYALAIVAGVPFLLATALAVAMCAALGGTLELALYRPLQRRRAMPTVLLIASLGVYVALQNGLSMLFGDGVTSLREGSPAVGFSLAGAHVTQAQLSLVIAAVVLFASTHQAMRLTAVGKAVRAVANDPELAQVSGIDAKRISLLTSVVGSAIAAVVAVLVSLDVDMVPTMGMNALLMGVVASIVGGIGSIGGAAIGGLLLGFAQQFGVWKLGSQWQDAIAFAVLLVFLFARPYGVFGRKLTKAEV